MGIQSVPIRASKSVRDQVSPEVFLKPGDKVRIERDCVGTLENPLEQGD